MLEFFIIENIMQQGLPFQLTDSGMDTNCYIGIDFSLIDLIYRQLSIAIEGMDLLYLVSEESEPVRMIQ